MKYYFLLLAVLLFGCAFGELDKCSEAEKVALKIFIRVLAEDSEAGYVYFNQKPVCIHGYFFKDPFRVNSANHKEAVALKEGALVWKKLKKKESDIIIHISQAEDPQIRGYAHVLVINKPLFHQVVNENLSLFQYVLGPAVTSQTLLDALVVDDRPFHSLLKYEKVLIGIILGFGTQNSLYASRMENIMEASDKTTPPFLSTLLARQEFDEEFLPFPPSFGFKTTQEELDVYSKSLVVSSSNLQQKNPNFIFGWFKDEIKNKKFILSLEGAQNKIQTLLNSGDFETKIIEKITGESGFIKSKELNSESAESINLKFDGNEINEIIAKGLWELLRHDDFEFYPYFIEGMENPNLKNLQVERLAYFPNYYSDFIKAKENLKIADSHFQSIHNDVGFQCVEPFKLYYKTIVTEANPSVCKGFLVTLTYSIYSPLNHHIAHGSSELINLKNTIAGFAHGVKGMCVGETREIHIHPSLAYGFDSNDVDKCIYLKAVVTLEEAHNEGILPNMKFHDFDFLWDPEAIKCRETNYKNALMVKGAKISSHLRGSKEIDISQIKDCLNKFYQSKAGYTPTTEAEQEIINRVQWNIYWS